VNKNYRLLQIIDRIIIVLVTDTLYYGEGTAQKLIPMILYGLFDSLFLVPR